MKRFKRFKYKYKKPKSEGQLHRLRGLATVSSFDRVSEGIDSVKPDVTELKYCRYIYGDLGLFPLLYTAVHHSD